MSYENAPATRMLSTHCAACSRPLLDAASVTAGLGPECRRKYAMPDALDEDTRRAANEAIHRAAREDATAEDLAAVVLELGRLGCEKLAARISERAGNVAIEILDDGTIAVSAPYSAAFLSGRGRGRWDSGTKTTRYQPAHHGDATRAIVAAYGAHRAIRVSDGWVSAAQLPAWIASRVTAAEAAPAVVARFPATPAKTRAGAWGACVTDTAAQAGDVVEIRASSGKAWLARLVGLDARRAWGDVWTTSRV